MHNLLSYHFSTFRKKYKTLFPFLLATMLMSAKAVHCSFFCAFRLSLSKNAYDNNSLLPLQKILLRRLIRGISRFSPFTTTVPDAFKL